MKLAEQQKKHHLSSSHHENIFNRPSKRGGHGYGSIKSSSAYQKIREHLIPTQSIFNQRHGQSSRTSSQFTGSVCRQCRQAHTGVCHIGTDLCFRCGQKGHLVKDCTVPKMINLGDTRACFNCGQPEHLARDCTRTASSASTRVGSNRISSGSQRKAGGEVRMGLGLASRINEVFNSIDKPHRGKFLL
ncbi:hypothetical protein CsSME_00026458 [Camellia sinensis var. sinensis]